MVTTIPTNISNFEDPTPEEVEQVDRYWAQVHRLIATDGEEKVTVRTPDPSLTRRVGMWKERQAALNCTHPSFVFDSGYDLGVRCGGPCGRPVQILTDIQIEQIKADAVKAANA